MEGQPAWMSRSNIARPMDGGGVFGSSGRDGDMPECGDFKRGACFRATCKFMHNGRPASEQPPPGVPGSNNAGAAGLPTPKAAGGFMAPADLDHNLYDPNTGFGLYGTHVFGTRYGMIGNLPKIENVRPLCMDFFKQGFCNRRGPHNQGCLFRHDEIEGKGKIDDSGMVKRVTDQQVQLFTMEAQARCSSLFPKLAKSDVEDDAKAYAKMKEAELIAAEEAEKLRLERKAQYEEAQAKAQAEAEEMAKRAAEMAAANPVPDPAAAKTGDAENGDGGEEPLPEGWRATKAPDGRFYYYHKATKKTQWTRPKPGDEPPAGSACGVAGRRRDMERRRRRAMETGMVRRRRRPPRLRPRRQQRRRRSSGRSLPDGRRRRRPTAAPIISRREKTGGSVRQSRRRRGRRRRRSR